MIDRALRTVFNAMAPPPMIWEPQVHGRLYPDRPYFLTRVRQGLSKLAPELQASFKEKGCVNYVCRRGSQAINVSPELSEVYQRQTWFGKQALKSQLSNTEAFVLFREKIMLSPQSHFMGTIPVIVSSMIQRGTIKQTLHETGHLFDRICSDDENRLFSKSDTYKDALRKDIDQMSRWDKNKVFLHIHGVRGLHEALTCFQIETFAEIFAEINLERPRLSKIMPNTARVIEEQIQTTIDNYRAANPDFDPDTYPKMEIAA